MTERIAVRGLYYLAARIFLMWGGFVLLKGLWDCFAGQPEANFYSTRPWEFVTRAEWLRYAGFELVYGIACVSLAHVIGLLARRAPEWFDRPRPHHAEEC